MRKDDPGVAPCGGLLLGGEWRDHVLFERVAD